MILRPNDCRTNAKLVLFPKKSMLKKHLLPNMSLVRGEYVNAGAQLGFGALGARVPSLIISYFG